MKKCEYQVLKTGEKMSIINNQKLVDLIRDKIKELSSCDHCFTVEFVKKNGELRRMHGSFNPPEEWKASGTGLKYNPADSGLMPVWDLDKEAWRMVNTHTVFSISGTVVDVDVEELEIKDTPTIPLI